MKLYRISYTLHCFSLIFIILTFSSYKLPDELENMLKRIRQKQFAMELNLVMYENGSSANSKILEREQFVLSIFNDKIKYKTKSYEAYSDGVYDIAVYRDHQQIVINKAIKNKLKVKVNGISELFDSISNIGTTYKLINTDKIINTYQVINDNLNEKYEKVLIGVNIKEYKPVFFEFYYYNNLNELLNLKEKKFNSSFKPVLVGKYVNFNYISSFNPVMFNYSHILTFNKEGQHVLKSEFSNYNVANYVYKK